VASNLTLGGFFGHKEGMRRVIVVSGDSGEHIERKQKLLEEEGVKFTEEQGRVSVSPQCVFTSKQLLSVEPVDWMELHQ
jgi:hypothetical protein